MKITSYNIDNDNVLHTWINNLKHVTITNVKSDKQANRIINELDKEVE